MSASHDIDFPLAWTQGVPSAIIKRAENAVAWRKTARLLDEETPAEASDRDLASANLAAAEREIQLAHALLKEFQGDAA